MKIKNILRDDFVKSISILAAGTGLAQIIYMFSTPVLTRLYTPEEFGIFSIYLSVLYSISSLGSLSYEQAIPLPEKDRDAYLIFSLSIIINMIMSIVIILLITMFWIPITELLHIRSNTLFMLLPLSFLGFGVFQSLTLWELRKRNYSNVSKAKLTMNGAQAIVQSGLGYYSGGGLGLVTGEVLARAAGGFIMIRTFKWNLLRGISIKEIYSVFVRYKRFPLLTTPAGLINAFTFHLPAFLIAFKFGAAEAGFLLMAQRLLSVPEALIGNSATQVFTGQAAFLKKDNPDMVLRLFKSTLIKLGKISIPLFIIGYVAAPVLLPAVLGSEWSGAIFYFQWLTIFYLLQVLVNPISRIFQIYEQQKLQLLSEIIRISLIAACSFIILYSDMNPIKAIALLSITGTAGYVLHGLISWIAIQKGLAEDTMNAMNVQEV